MFPPDAADQTTAAGREAMITFWKSTAVYIMSTWCVLQIFLHLVNVGLFATATTAVEKAKPSASDYSRIVNNMGVAISAVLLLNATYQLQSNILMSAASTGRLLQDMADG